MQEGLSLLREYESLRQSLIRHERYCESLKRRILELERSGKLSLPEYFGSFAPPQRSPQGELSAVRPLHEGVFLLKTGRGRQLAIHEAVAERYLTAVAAAAGEFLGDYCFFDEDSGMPVVFFELSAAFPDIRRLVDMPTLYAALRCYCPAYVSFYNDIYGSPPIPQGEGDGEGYLLL